MSRVQDLDSEQPELENADDETDENVPSSETKEPFDPAQIKIHTKQEALQNLIVRLK